MANQSYLDPHDWSRLEVVLRDLYAPTLVVENYVERALQAVRSLVPGEFATYSRALRKDPGGFDIVFSNNDCPSMDVLIAYTQVKDQYDLWNSDLKVRDGGVLFLRDFYSRRQFRQLDIFATTYHPAGLDNHCAIPVCHDEGSDIFLSIQRKGGTDFTEAERTLLGLLQPHLRNARVLARERSTTGKFQVTDLDGMGLTPRELEVFYWIVEGKRNAEIAAILKLKLDTVKSHVERIFHKLKVENRHAAIRLGFERVIRASRDEWKSHQGDPRTYFISKS